MKYIYIYIYSCWCFNYAWCMRYHSGISTHMQSIEIQHMQSQRTMHVDKSQRPRLGHAITKSHFNSSLTFLKALEHPRTSHFPRVHAKIWILTSLLSLFLLKKVLGSSLESSSQVHRFTHPKERQNPTQKSSPYLIFLAASDQKVQPSFPTPFSLFLLSSLFALTWQPSLFHQSKISLSKEEI